MTGHDYEHLVAAYLKNKGYTGVKVTKGSGDYGVDVIAHKGKKRYAVQCKYYTSPVSLGAVQEAVAGKAMYGCNAAMVVTNNTFTKAAKELAEQNDVLLIPCVTSPGASAKDVCKIVKVIALIVLILFTIGGVMDMIESIQSGDTQTVLLDICLLIILWLICFGIPFGVKRLLRYIRGRKPQGIPDEARVISTPDVSNENPLRSEPANEAVATAVPPGFEKYVGLSKSPTHRNNIVTQVTQVTQEMTLSKLEKLREDDFELYSHLYGILKPFWEGEHISTSAIQRKYKYGYAKAAKLIDTLEDIGIISNDDTIRTILVAEQDMMHILGEIEQRHTN